MESLNVFLRSIYFDGFCRLDERLDDATRRHRIACSMVNWEAVAHFMSNVNSSDIYGMDCSLEDKKVTLIERWYEMNRERATYRHLAECLFQANNMEALKTLCQELSHPSPSTGVLNINQDISHSPPGTTDQCHQLVDSNEIEITDISTSSELHNPSTLNPNSPNQSTDRCHQLVDSSEMEITDISTSSELHNPSTLNPNSPNQINQGPTTTIEPADEGLPGPPSPRVKSSEGIPSCEVFINQVTPSSCLQASIKKEVKDNFSDPMDSTESENDSITDASEVRIDNDGIGQKDNSLLPKTRGETLYQELPPVDKCDEIFPENGELLPIATVSHYTEKFVILASVASAPPLDDGSVFWTREKVAVAKVFETFGPVIKPFYSIRINSAGDLSSLGIQLGDTLYFIANNPAFTKYVFPQELMKSKGSDASWKDDNEVPPQFQDYSDDEDEKKASTSKRKTRKASFKRNSRCSHQQTQECSSSAEVWNMHHYPPPPSFPTQQFHHYPRTENYTYASSAPSLLHHPFPGGVSNDPRIFYGLSYYHYPDDSHPIFMPP